MISLAELQSLYDQNRFLDAFRQIADYWKPSQSLVELTSDQLIFSGRLAVRLGGRRLSRKLFRTALARDPLDARVRYFTQGLRRRGRRMFDELLSWQTSPELPGADAITQASWLAWQSIIWASLRDFARAHDCIQRAYSLKTKESWVVSCESDVFGLEDRWKEALESAELAWEMNPGTPYAAQNLGESLVSLGRIREAAERLAAAVENCQSFEVAHLACWHLCALAETVDGDERSHVLRRANELAGQLAIMAPLADRETRSLFARTRLDIGELSDDHVAMERWADEAHSPFHRRVLENLRKNPNGLRVRLPFRHAIQKHDECLPTSVVSALAAMGTEIDADAMASELTFGGTPEWAASEWLQKGGLEVKFYAVTPDVACRLIKNGIAFVMTLEADASAHAVAAVGLDEAAGTLIVHDPSMLRASEYLLESIGMNEVPIGPRGMATVPREKAALLDELLPRDDAEAVAARAAHHRAVQLANPVAARNVVNHLIARLPTHPITRLLIAMQAVEDGRVGVALVEFQNLLKLFPGSAFVRSRILSCCRSLGDTALMRRTLASVVEQGVLPGIQSRQDWLHPPSAYVSGYADLLRMSAETRERALSLLHSVIQREGSSAQAWHVLADLLWDESDTDGAVLAYRIAACLAGSNEHYARAYCYALGNLRRQEEGLAWLENRVKTFGASSHAIATWRTWINALEDWGHPERALAAAEQSLKIHGDSPELLAFLVPFSARMGRWQEADAFLLRLETAGNSALFHEAAVDFHERRGALDMSLSHAEAWVQESPLSMGARRELLHLIAKRDGVHAALERVSRWLAEHQSHDEMEQLYCEYLEQSSAPRWKKYSVLLRRIKRNPEDGWALRELAFGCIADFECKDERGRRKLKDRISGFVEECDRTAPRDAATLRVHAQWCEVQGQWSQAIEHWLESINREPSNSYGYRQLWDCMARSAADQRKQLWQKMSAMLLSYAGRLTAARETMVLAAQRFGIAETEVTLSLWRDSRPDDPEVVEAYADILLEHGHGRTDAQRALDLLQPAVQRFPYHLGLRFSLANALRKLGEFAQAEDVFSEIIRRHPESIPARIQLARVHERHGRVDDALGVLATAECGDPQNVELFDVQAHILISAGRTKEARACVDNAIARFPKSVPLRERAIRLYSECGDNEAAVRTAREGTHVYPRGAYLWLLLGKTLNQMPHFAAQGEVETCLRRSLALNEGLFEAGERLAMLLVEQRGYTEAEQVMLQIRERLGDPSPAMGRLAWIHRAKGDKAAARKELASALRFVPWYSWGWSLLMDWLAEDKAWDEARTVLGSLPPELRTNTQFRRQRLVVLEKAGVPASQLDEEWSSLLIDFPEEVALHLHRYDSLRSAKRLPEAAAVLESIRPIDPDSPYVLARFVEVLASDPAKKDQAIEPLVKVLFAQHEESVWPADYAWKAVKDAQLDEAAYQKAHVLLQQGSRPTYRALSILASYATERGKTEKRRLQPYWRTWFPDRGARELLALLRIVDSAAWSKVRYRADLLKQLTDVGYARLVAKYWKNNEDLVQPDVGAWAETARALVVLKRRSNARKLLAGWRERTGVEMWVVANYVTCLSALRPKQLREMLYSCRDALAGLPHDHCAKFLVHRQAEVCALNGDKKAFSDTWEEHRSYFDGKLENEEWFDTRRRYLLADLPILAKSLEENSRGKYRRTLWNLRRKRFAVELRLPQSSGKKVALRWWWIILWFLFALLSQLLQHR